MANSAIATVTIVMLSIVITIIVIARLPIRKIVTITKRRRPRKTMMEWRQLVVQHSQNYQCSPSFP